MRLVLYRLRIIRSVGQKESNDLLSFSYIMKEMDKMTMTKICSKCKEEKPLSEYHKNGFDRQGNQKYRGYCKECARKIEAARY
mgnify:FL=1